jgi:hypothetical protein
MSATIHVFKFTHHVVTLKDIPKAGSFVFQRDEIIEKANSSSVSTHQSKDGGHATTHEFPSLGFREVGNSSELDIKRVNKSAQRRPLIPDIREQADR